MDELIKTGVDELLELLSHNPKMTLQEAAKKLKAGTDIVQAWVDFLVEEGIVGIEYKFTTPYIYMNKGMSLKAQQLRSDDSGPIITDLSYFKNQFWNKARTNNIQDNQIQKLWVNHLLQEIELKRRYFNYEAERRKLKNIDNVWQEYRDRLLKS